MAGARNPMILFTVDFDADVESDEAPFKGWDLFAELAFGARDDFRAVVNFVGVALERLSADAHAFKRLVQLVRDGRIFPGNHSWDHPSFTGEYTGTPALSRAEQADQLLRAQEYIASALAEPIFFRAPFFNHNNDTLQLVTQLGIRYDLSRFIREDDFAPVMPCKYRLPSYETLIRIDTNLKLYPLEWVEPIASWSGEPLEPGGLYNIIVHPSEFSEPGQAEEMLARLNRLLGTDVDFIGPPEIEMMLL